MPKINVVDIFAGPGGLGEGFARYSPENHPDDRPFQLVLSAERDPAAVRTLRLRTFYRLCELNGGVPETYYQYVRGERGEPHDAATADLWARATAETERLEMGTEIDDQRLTRQLNERLGNDSNWVLIGGPPCQAYSLAGRSRNKGVRGYRPERDDRHFLYQHYLRILAEHQPAAFVMENVKGILSSRVNGRNIFPSIVRDLAQPARAVNGVSGAGYQLQPLVFPDYGEAVDDPHCFLVRGEDHCIPQARHRVIVLGVREDLHRDRLQQLDRATARRAIPLDTVLNGLPRLHSGVRQAPTCPKAWESIIEQGIDEHRRSGLSRNIARNMQQAFRNRPRNAFAHGRGGRFVPQEPRATGRTATRKALLSWLRAPRLHGTLNHESRTHMPSDLIRYLFASTYARSHERSPTARDFPDALAPAHRNWASGAFADRFRVQVSGHPSTTITSHIAKDGHYYIHPDPCQCRSLTVREAARLQTFPDDFFFEGNRTEQYVQVGNAVPPFLAHQIAAIVRQLFA